MNIIQALDDPTIFGTVIRDPSTWGAWRAFLKALFALPMDDAEAELFRRCTARATLPVAPFNVAQLCCGRRAGKSFCLAIIAVFLACFRDYQPFLALGEKATIIIVAADRRQARVIFRYCRGILQSVAALRGLIEGETNEELRLTQRRQHRGDDRFVPLDPWVRDTGCIAGRGRLVVGRGLCRRRCRCRDRGRIDPCHEAVRIAWCSAQCF